jgi:outer membrane cobalamin receptor
LTRLVLALRGIAAASCALACTASPSARADESEPPTFREEEVVVRIPRTEAAADPTASATVVEANRFAGEVKGVAELVATAPGVAVQDYGGLGHLTTVSIRGATADGVKVLLDGIPLNTAAGGGVDLSSIPRAWIDHIEVVRGAEGAHFGAGALGGVVNVVTKKAAAGAWSLQGSGGSFATFSASGDAAVGGDRWALLGAATLEGSDGSFPYLSDPTPETGGARQSVVRKNDVVRLGGGLVKGWHALGAGRLDVLAQVSGGRRELPGWPTLTPDDWQEDARAAGVARVDQPLGSSLFGSLELSARYDRLDVEIQQLGPRVSRQRDRAGAARGEVQWLHRGGTLTVAGSAGLEELSSDGTGTRDRPALAVSLSEDATFLGDRLRLAPALRLESIGQYAGLSGKLGSTLRLLGPLKARASVGRSFRPPSFAELYLQQGILEPNPDLVSEEAWTADLGIVAEGRLGLVSAGGFASVYRDLIVYEPGSFQRLKPFNDGKASIRGLEIEAASAPAPRLLGLCGTVAYTLLSSETLRGAPEVVGKDLPYRPRHRLYARVALEQPGWGGHVEAHWVGSQFHDARNLRPFSSTTAVNAGASLRLLARPDLRLSLEVKNVLDDRTVVNAFGNPLPARTVLLTVRVANPERG